MTTCNLHWWGDGGEVMASVGCAFCEMCESNKMRKANVLKEKAIVEAYVYIQRSPM